MATSWYFGRTSQIPSCLVRAGLPFPTELVRGKGTANVQAHASRTLFLLTRSSLAKVRKEVLVRLVRFRTPKTALAGNNTPDRLVAYRRKRLGSCYQDRRRTADWFGWRSKPAGRQAVVELLLGQKPDIRRKGKTTEHRKARANVHIARHGTGAADPDGANTCRKSTDKVLVRGGLLIGLHRTYERK